MKITSIVETGNGTGCSELSTFNPAGNGVLLHRGHKTLRCCQGSGCFIAGTQIKLKQDESISIENFHGGPVLRADGRFSLVVDGRAGYEKPLVCYIKTEDGYEIGVTETHPMPIWEEGVVEVLAAQELAIGDKLIVVAENSTVHQHSTICEIARRSYNGIVYNIEIEGKDDVASHLIIANDIVTGDLYLQELVENRLKDETDADTTQQIVRSWYMK